MNNDKKINPKLILFDVDLTLIQTAGCGRRAFARAFQEITGIPDGVEKISMSGKTDTAILKEAISLSSLVDFNSETKENFWKKYLLHLENELKKSKEACISPGILKLLDSLVKNDSCKIGLLTGNIKLGAKIKLERFGLWSYFPTGGFGDDAEDRNTVARIAVSRCFENYHLFFEQQNIYVIGDSLLDIACAKAIKARAVAVATGVHKYEILKAQKPFAVFENFSNPEQVLRLIEAKV
jgi:phosphoglycolate phosphatase-like HAD superfamily hydrolase